jgi:hypothetical protein
MPLMSGLSVFLPSVRQPLSARSLPSLDISGMASVRVCFVSMGAWVGVFVPVVKPGPPVTPRVQLVSPAAAS